MNTIQPEPNLQIAHTWWRKITLSYVPAQESPLLEDFVENLLDRFRIAGHNVFDEPGPDTEVLLTTSQFNQPIRWRDALIFTARRRFITHQIFDLGTTHTSTVAA